MPEDSVVINDPVNHGARIHHRRNSGVSMDMGFLNGLMNEPLNFGRSDSMASNASTSSNASAGSTGTRMSLSTAPSLSRDPTIASTVSSVDNTIDVSVNQLFPNEATAVIWRDKKVGPFPTSHFGHAAVLLRGSMFATPEYVSWWPADGASIWDALKKQAGWHGDDYADDMKDEIAERAQRGLAAGTMSPRAGQFETRYGWGNSSNAQVSIPGICGIRSPFGLPGPAEAAARQPFGLSLASMANYWRSFKNNGGKYKLASKTMSCAGVSIESLKAGGGELFAKTPYLGLYASPSNVEDWARTLQREILKFNREAVAFYDRAIQSQRSDASAPRTLHRQIWTVDQWKQASSMDYKIRSNHIKKIDERLAKYHRAATNTGSLYRYQLMVEMMRLLVEHQKLKPNSGRKKAVLMLGRQIVEVTNRWR